MTVAGSRPWKEETNMQLRAVFIRFGLAALGFTAVVPAAVIPAMPAQYHRYITQLYGDLLSRHPAPSELNLLQAILNSGAPKSQAVGLITSGNEYRSDVIGQCYSQFLNRPATPGEVTYFLSLLQSGATDDDMKSATLGSDEYLRLSGGTNPAFLARLYQDVLGRSVDRLAAAAFEDMLVKGTPRQTIASVVLHSLEADQRVVTLMFEKFLHRAPQPSELSTYAQILQLGAKDEQIVNLICGSDEYFENAVS
jgi:hypothetical protein